MDEEIYKEIKRTFLKYIVLKIIKDRPTHGYEIMKKVELLSKGRWTPSAGSIYPILESLESKGFIHSEKIDRRKVHSITSEGMDGLLKDIPDEIQEKIKQEITEELAKIQIPAFVGFGIVTLFAIATKPDE
jgi:DNA-binding PadR family transcriptional regulator